MGRCDLYYCCNRDANEYTRADCDQHGYADQHPDAHVDADDYAGSFDRNQHIHGDQYAYPDGHAVARDRYFDADADEYAGSADGNEHTDGDLHADVEQYINVNAHVYTDSCAV